MSLLPRFSTAVRARGWFSIRSLHSSRPVFAERGDGTDPLDKLASTIDSAGAGSGATRGAPTSTTSALHSNRTDASTASGATASTQRVVRQGAPPSYGSVQTPRAAMVTGQPGQRFSGAGAQGAVHYSKSFQHGQVRRIDPCGWIQIPIA